MCAGKNVQNGDKTLTNRKITGRSAASAPSIKQSTPLSKGLFSTLSFTYTLMKCYHWY